MMIRFFKHGDGSGRSAIDYLVANEVPAYDDNRNRIPDQVEVRTPLPEVLRGDAGQTVDLIDSNYRKWRYTSGVIAFAAEDEPTPADIEAVMHGFEQAAFAGLESDQYDCLWVRHSHKGNTELHFIVPRVELYDGEAFNIAPPRSEYYFNAFRDYWNCLKGWACPDDPDRRRMLKPVFERKDRSEIRDAIREHIVTKIESGQVRNHQDVLAALSDLQEAGLEIKPPRPSKKAQTKPATKIVVRRIGSVGTQETYRLEDRIFHEDWTADEYFASEHQRENRARNRSLRKPDRRGAEELRRKLEVAIGRRANINRKRYEKCRRSHALLIGHDGNGHRQTSEKHGTDNRRDVEAAPALASGEAVAVHSDTAWDRRGGSDDRGNRGIHNSTPADRDEGRNTTAKEWVGAVSEGDGPWGRRDGAGAAGGGGGATLPIDDPSGSPLRQNSKSGELNHGPDPYGARIAEIRQSVGRAIERIRDVDQALSRQDRDGDAARYGRFGRLREVIGRVSAAIGRLVQGISSGGSGRWFRNEGFGGGAAEPAKQAERPRVTFKSESVPTGP
ncbi:relaxase/mobilization nuclease domain-containing protein [Aliiroseovarius sp. CAU 1755]